VHRVLTRHGLNRLRWMDRPTGQVIRRYERSRPGELVHVDIKKLGNIPDGGGHRIMTRQQALADERCVVRRPMAEGRRLLEWAADRFGRFDGPGAVEISREGIRFRPRRWADHLAEGR
jgi:hypothetical protein